ncbi:MAG: adenylate/guanylate cyclase domain-containing protein, partial [Candidatus Promineifilaceae bacterium]
MLDPSCPNCGMILPEASRYCIECGIQLANLSSLGGWNTVNATNSDNRWQNGPSHFQPGTDVLAGEEAIVASGQTITSKVESKSNILQRFLPRELSDKLDAARAGDHVVGERRVVTMLFCDIAGSTAAAENLDPEEWTEIINGAFEHMIRPVYKYEGTVARLMGDAILAFFGAPIAHEDDPVRAVLAGLDIVAGFTIYKEHVRDHRGLHIDLRVGINTGMVVTGAVGSDLRMEYTAMGDAVNLAARMEQSAEPGSVQITKSTCELVEPWFEVKEIGSISVKGKDEPVNAFRVIGRRPQFDQKPVTRHTDVRLIGRERELARLIWAARHLAQGVGRGFCVLGEAGLGKSRLIDELEQQWPGPMDIEESSVRWSKTEWHRSASFSYETLQPYALFQRLLRHMAGITQGESEESAQNKIDQMIATFPDDGQDRLSAVVKCLLGYSSGLEGEAFKTELFVWLPEFFRHRFSTNPAVLVLDDIHWSDSASIELLLKLIPLVNEAAILLICLLRPDAESSGWLVRQAMEEAGHSKREVILLGPLSEGDSTTLIDEMLAIPDLPEAIRRQILDKSAGNPFFVEEVVRALVARGFIISFDEGRHWNVEVTEPLLIPENIQVLLTARIDRLAEETRHTLQLASVFGHSFYYQALVQVAQTEAELP